MSPFLSRLHFLSLSEGSVGPRLLLRRTLRARRRGLSCVRRRHAARAVARNSLLTRLLGKRHRLAFYLANDGELDPAQLMARMLRSGRVCYLPVLNRHRGRAMWFAPYSPGMPMTTNRFAIPEPRVVPRNRLRAAQLDVIVMPVVAFDDQGNRLGMGGGFYDRTLSFLRHRDRWRRPLLLGLAYEFQKLDRIESRSWDVPLDGVITEAGLRYFR